MLTFAQSSASTIAEDQVSTFEENLTPKSTIRYQRAKTPVKDKVGNVVKDKQGNDLYRSCVWIINDAGVRSPLMLTSTSLQQLINTDLQGVSDQPTRDAIFELHVKRSSIVENEVNGGKAFFLSIQGSVDAKEVSAKTFGKAVKGFTLTEALSRAI